VRLEGLGKFILWRNLDAAEKYLVESAVHVDAVQNSHAKTAAVILVYGIKVSSGSTMKEDFRHARPKQEYKANLLLLLLLRRESPKSILGLL
jgi:hypothetical protein